MITLPIFFKNEAYDIGELTGKQVPYKEFDIRKMDFYHINAVSPHLDADDNDKEYSCIHSNGSEFICALTIKEVREKL